MVGAAPLPGELAKQLADVLPDVSIFQEYGLTETSCAITMGPANRKVDTLGSAGRVLPGIVARITKADGTFADTESRENSSYEPPRLRWVTAMTNKREPLSDRIPPLHPLTFVVKYKRDVC